MIRLFVGGMNYNTDETNLRRWFEGTNGQPGYVVSEAVIVKDKVTGHSRGFGFVTLETEEDVSEVAARYHRQRLDGREVTVNVADPKPEWKKRERRNDI